MPKKRKRLPAAQRKKQILLCAVKVFGQSSYQAARVSDIAEQLRLDHQNYRELIGKVLKKGIQQGRIREDVDVDALTWIYDAVGVRLNLAKLLSLDEEFNEEIFTKILDHVEDSIKA